MKRVPKYIQGGETVKSMKKPRAWLQQDRRAQKAQERLMSRYGEEDWITSSGLVRSEKTYGGEHGFDVEVSVRSKENIEKLPEKINGITIRTEIDDKEATQAACANAGNFADYQGGMLISGSSNFVSDDTGTAGYPVTDGDKNYMLTAQHTFSGCDPTKFDFTYQKSENLGNIQEATTSGDYALTSASAQGTEIKNKIREPDGTERTVSGCASKEQIANRATSPVDGYTQIGVTTGNTVGGLGKKNVYYEDRVSSCRDFRNGQGIRGSADGAQGDSGGPMYSVEDGDAFVLGHLCYVKGLKSEVIDGCGDKTFYRYDTSFGFPAHLVENDGYTVGI